MLFAPTSMNAGYGVRFILDSHWEELFRRMSKKPPAPFKQITMNMMLTEGVPREMRSRWKERGRAPMAEAAVD